MSAQQRLLPRDDGLPMVRLAMVPDAAPPYDGDPHGARVPVATALPLAGTRKVSGTVAATGKGPGAIATGKGPGAVAGTRTGSVATKHTSHSGLVRGGEDWPRQFAQVLAEALAGSRPARQIVPWTTQRARVQFGRIGSLLACGQRPRILRMVISRPAPDVMEMTIVAGFGQRTRALAVRLERTARHRPTPGQGTTAPAWLCTDIETA